MTKPYSIELPYETIDKITVDNLTQARDTLQRDLDNDIMRVFSIDPEEDRVEIQKHIDAINIVLSYISVPEVKLD